MPSILRCTSNVSANRIGQVRVGDHYRAVGMLVGPEFLWQWVGTHEEYNQQY
jgi:hypothetical protein